MVLGCGRFGSQIFQVEQRVIEARRHTEDIIHARTDVLFFCWGSFWVQTGNLECQIQKPKQPKVSVLRCFQSLISRPGFRGTCVYGM